MNPLAVIFLIVNVIALFVLPRKWAPVPLLMGACYMTNAQSINLGPFHFTVVRILLAIGFLRAISRGERLPGGLVGLDKLLLLWAAWFLCSSAFHRPFGDALVFRLGSSYNVLGIYFLMRIFCRTQEDLIQTIKIIAILLIPVALEMVHEKLTGRNLFAAFGGVPVDVLMREGKYRAQGPFGHSILAGTVGGLCVPLMVGIWSRHKIAARAGLVACLTMAVASASSGPIMTIGLGFFGLAMWKWRVHINKLLFLAVAFYMVCNMAMTRPAYYLLEKIDLAGGSTGYHRAALMESATIHLNEWWLTGTDYTRHWMPYGVSSSPDQCDITNHYLFYGVDGGFPLMFIFIAIVWFGFRYIKKSLRLRSDASIPDQFLIWSVGCGLFAHAATMISVAYFDQSVMFLYLNLAVIGSIYATAAARAGAAARVPADIPLDGTYARHLP